jgi:hypothetical protein
MVVGIEGVEAAVPAKQGAFIVSLTIASLY